MDHKEIAATPQPSMSAPVLAQFFLKSKPSPNMKPKYGAILMFPVGATNQVLKNIGKKIVMPNKIRRLKKSSNSPVESAERVLDIIMGS